MRHFLSMIPLLLLPSLLVSSCAAPASMICDRIIEGVVQLDTGQPLAYRKVQIMLPADYGLNAIDLAFAEPSDYGDQDEQYFAFTDDDGAFSCDLGARMTHVPFWILPPLGFLFSEPPAPLVICRLSQFSQEHYAVAVGHDDFLVFSEGEGEIPIEKARLKSITSSHSVLHGDDIWQSVSFIKLVFRNDP